MLTNEMAATGRWLFRWRSYLPLAIVPLFVSGLRESHDHFEGSSLDLYCELVCLGISLVGLAVRLGTVGFVPKGTSGRGTKAMRAAALNTTGMYSIVRHPLYLGNFIIFAGVLVDIGAWHVVLIGVLAFWLYYERVMLAEETYLHVQHGEAFRRWAATTPAVFPQLSLWRPPDLSFSMRSSVAREYSTLFLTVCVFTGIECARDSMIHAQLEISRFWLAILAVNATFYTVVRLIKKRTHFFDAVGR